jgi:alpha-glucosidase
MLISKLYSTNLLRSRIAVLIIAVVVATLSSSRAGASTDVPTYATKVDLGSGIEISFYTPTMFRFRESRLTGSDDPAKYEISFLMGHTNAWPEVPFHLHQDEKFAYIKTSVLQIRVSRTDHSWTVWTEDGQKQIYPSSGPAYGIFRDGYTEFNAASAFDQPTFYSRFEHWFYSPATGRYVDTYLADDLIYDQFFIYGPGYDQLFRQLKDLVGAEPLLPRKAYGFFQTQHLGCKGSQTQLMEVARQFRERHIPVDTLIVDYEWGDGCPGGDEDDQNWGRLDWSPSYSKPLSPGDMVAALHRMHYDLMLIQHSSPDFPHRAEDVKREKEREWTSKTYDEKLWWNKVREKLDLGVDGIWQDTRKNDVTDSVIWNGLHDYYGAARRVLFMGNRNMVEMDPWSPQRDDSFPGGSLLASRRYPFRWSGDAHTTWSELQWHINALTNTFSSMAGVDYVTADGYAADWKQQARWNQFLDFVTVARSHTMKPWDRGLAIEELANTMAFGEKREAVTNTPAKEFSTGSRNPAHSDQTPSAEESIRENLRLRYRLLPYLYSESFQQYETGFPILRPMVLAFPDDPYCQFDRERYQYMFGDWFLVAPVWADLNSMDVYLPKGTDWIDYWGRRRYLGGQVVEYDTSDTNKLPLFVKAGAIIPMRKDQEWIEPDQPADPVILDIYPGQTATSFALYEDDGITTHYQSGQFAETILQNQPETNGNLTFTIDVTRGEYSGKPESRPWILRFNLEPTTPRAVVLNGKDLRQALNPADFSVKDTGWIYDSENQLLMVKNVKNASEILTVRVVQNSK